jgi:hypothetical protein
MIIRSQGVSVPFWLDASDILLVNRQEQVVSLSGVVVDTVVLFDPVNATGQPEEWAHEISVFPNPAAGEVFIQSSAPLTEFVLFATAGNLVLRDKTEGLHELRLDLAGLPQGLYFLKIKAAYGWTVKKLLVK